jgi:hypothetical protein
VATFYLLPPRPQPASRYNAFVQHLLPGMSDAKSTWGELAEVLTATLARTDDIYLVHRDDLPPGEEPELALIQGFGAEAGDRVVVIPTDKDGAAVTWRIQCRAA